MFHGNGGYDFHTIYNMPIWLRNFTFNKMKEYFEKQNQEMKKAQAGSSQSSTVIGEDGKVKSPDFLKSTSKSQPTYTAKASKK